MAIYKTKSDGNVFKELRRKTKLTQYEVAEALSIKQTTVSAWETSVSIPDQALLPRIAELYGTTVDYLLTGKEPQSKPIVKVIEKTAPKSYIEELFDSVSEEGKKHILATAEMIYTLENPSNLKHKKDISIDRKNT